MRTLSAKMPNMMLGNKPNTPAAVKLLREAELWLDSKYSVEGEPRVINQGAGGSVLDAKYGSVLGAYVYDGRAIQPGLNGNGLSVPDAPEYDVTDLEIMFDGSLPDVTSTNQHLVCRDTQSGVDRLYYFTFAAGGNLQLVWWDNGAAVRSATSTVPPSITNNVRFAVKVTLDVDNGSSLYEVKFYSAPTSDGPWTQLGTTITGGATSIRAGATGISFGVANTVSRPSIAPVNINRAWVKGVIDGPAVLDVDLANVPNYATSFLAVTGQTVTVNSTTSDTNDPLFLPHTGENYLHFPGVGNELTFPDSVPLRISTDAEAVFLVKSSNWNQNVYFWRKPNNVEFRVISSAATTRFGISWVDSTPASGGHNNMYAPVLPINTWVWIKFVLDVNNEAGEKTSTVSWELDVDGTEPSVYSNSVSETTAGAITLRTDVVVAGDICDGGLFDMRRAIVRDGIDGTKVFDLRTSTDITNAGVTSFTATSGQTITVSRAATGRKTALVTRPIWLFGTDDYLEVADNDLLDIGADENFTLLTIARRWPTLAIRPYIQRTAYSTEGSYQLIGWSDGDLWLQGSGETTGKQYLNVTSTNPVTAGKLSTLVGVMNRPNSHAVYVDNEKTINVGTFTQALTSADPLRVGPAAFDGEIVASALFKRALTDSEVALITSYYGTV